MLKFYCWITGDDYEMLRKDTPQSRKKVSALATVLFIPVIIWVMSGYLLVTDVLGGSTISGISVAGVLGILVFLLEKNIIMAQGGRAIFLFRIVLATVIALLGAVILDEVIFKEDIERQLAFIEQEQLLEEETNIRQLNIGIIQDKKNEVEVKHTVWQQAVDIARREADGSGGSGVRGVDAITRIKLEAAAEAKSDYLKTSGELAVLEAKLDREILEARNSLLSTSNHYGLLNRIKALFSLVFSDWYMGIIYALFTLFVFFMEFLVVFMKNAWATTNYERKLQLIEEIGKSRMEKVRANDSRFFEPGKLHGAHKEARDYLLTTQSTSRYN